MKRKIVNSVLIVFVILLCTACNGSITREIRHAGFSIGDKFICNGFFPENKDDTSYDRIRYFTGNHLVDQNGKIYETSIGQQYQNKQNCKPADTKIIVKAIYDDKIVKAMDDRYYYLIGEKEVPSYSEIPETDNSYSIYNLLLKDSDVVKVITANSSTGEYYILKNDGNVYGYTITKKDHDSPPAVTAISIVYSKNDFDSDIIDFNYAGESLNTFVRTENKIYRMKITNSKSCTKYADIKCKYKMMVDDTFEKYKEKILMYNGSMLITDYNQIFTIASK